MPKLEKGAVGPKTDKSNVAAANAEKVAHKASHPMLKLFASILSSAVWFLLIWGVAVGLGWVVGWTDINCGWVPDSMIAMAHWVEHFLFGADAVCLVWAVLMHVKAFITGRH